MGHPVGRPFLPRQWLRKFKGISTSKANELLRQMIENPSEEMPRPVRKTLLLPQPDGSLVRRVTDKAGNVTEDTISAATVSVFNMTYF
jgi:hypothetical protein